MNRAEVASLDSLSSEEPDGNEEPLIHVIDETNPLDWEDGEDLVRVANVEAITDCAREQLVDSGIIFGPVVEHEEDNPAVIAEVKRIRQVHNMCLPRWIRNLAHHQKR